MKRIYQSYPGRSKRIRLQYVFGSVGDTVLFSILLFSLMSLPDLFFVFFSFCLRSRDRQSRGSLLRIYIFTYIYVFSSSLLFVVCSLSLYSISFVPVWFLLRFLSCSINIEHFTHASSPLRHQQDDSAATHGKHFSKPKQHAKNDEINGRSKLSNFSCIVTVGICLK